VAAQFSASRSRPRRRLVNVMRDERTVHVVDDDAAVRRSLQWLLDSAGFSVVAYDTPFAFLDAAPRLSGGCILLDVRMPGMDGLVVQQRLAKEGIVLPVIVMTGQGDVQTAVRAMKAGAVDFIEKPFNEELLLNAIEVALTSAGRPDRSREASDASNRISALSPREREVLDALVAGHPNKVIAFDLGISVRTVEVHRARMMDRLGVRQLAEAIRLAVVASLAADNAPQRRPGGK
jgi:two-component system response regulator FixJ